MISLDMLINGKLKLINFYNIFYISQLEYNLFSVGTIKKVKYFILAKNEKIRLYNIKNNVAIKAIRIETSYLVNILIAKKTLALSFLYLVLYSYRLQTKQH